MSTDYILHQSQYIVDNQWTLIDDIRVAHENFKKLFGDMPEADSTAFYKYYNIFALTSPSKAFHEVYTELKTLIRTQLGDSEPLWFQAWLNHHDQDSVLDWHHHDRFHACCAFLLPQRWPCTCNSCHSRCPSAHQVQYRYLQFHHRVCSVQ